MPLFASMSWAAMRTRSLDRRTLPCEGPLRGGARAEVAARELTNVEIVEGDARAIDRPKEAFELVHSGWCW
jgi:hypothetical protein